MVMLIRIQSRLFHSWNNNYPTIPNLFENPIWEAAAGEVYPVELGPWSVALDHMQQQHLHSLDLTQVASLVCAHPHRLHCVYTCNDTAQVLIMLFRHYLTLDILLREFVRPG